MPNPKLVSWTSTISSLIRSGRAEVGLREFFLMCNSGMRPNEFGFSLALKASRIASEPAIGSLLHAFTIKSGFESYAFCSTSILDMYSKLGNMIDARRFFDNVPLKCEALWNALIDGHACCSDANEALGLFHQMLLSSTSPNSFTYTILIKLWASTADIDLLRFFHVRTIKSGFDKYNFVGGALVDAYGKGGELTDACRLFWSLEERDDIVWTALLAGFRHNGDAEQGLDLYLRFVSEGYRLDPFLFATVFNLCSDLGNPRLGFQVHSCLAKSGFVLDSFVGTAIIDMYVSFGMVADAHRIFIDTREKKNEVIFGAMVHGFICDSDYRNALELIYEMGKVGLVPDYSTLSCILRALTSLDMLEEGRVFHSRLIKTVGESDLIIGNNLIEMYSKCRAVDDAAKVFVAMELRNEFSWTALVSGYIDSERYEEALKLYHTMKSSGSVEPNQFTLVAVLQASSKLSELRKGKQTHGHITKKGFQSHSYIESALIGMYSNCGCMDDAFQIFSSMLKKDLVSWSNMIASYVQHGHGEKALKLFSEYKDGLIAVDGSIFSSCLSACSSLTALEMGRCIHAGSIKTGFESDLQVGGAIVDMYCKCGSIKDAREFFDRMREHSVVSYTSMISGYAQHGLGQEALHLFDEMKKAGLEPDGVTFVGVLSACSHFGLVKDGWDYFESMRKEYGLERKMNHYACMVDLLGRAGRVSEAEDLIAMAPFRSKALLWRTLLGACNKHGDIEAGNRIAEMLIRMEPDDPSTYVMLSNIYASASMWDHSIEVKSKMREGCLKKTPGCSWIEVAN